MVKHIINKQLPAAVVIIIPNYCNKLILFTINIINEPMINRTILSCNNITSNRQFLTRAMKELQIIHYQSQIYLI